LFSLKGVRFKDLIEYPDMEIPEEGATFICGESGCGKSTLLKLLNGVVSADAGEIRYAGKPVDEYDPVTLRREVLMCGQSAYLFDGSIEENFVEYCKYRELPRISCEEMSVYLKICAVDMPLDSACNTMSGGEKQRVFTAICLSFLPKVLLLDEPTSALDDMTADLMIASIKDFCRENSITPIVVSHNRAISESFADLVISLGNVPAEGGSRNE
jgi:putative ABC transport system ATP-binding protein